MSGLPKIFNALVEALSEFPGVGRRSAERMAMYVLKMNPDEAKSLAGLIAEAHQHVKPCKSCNSFTKDDTCQLCSDDKRDKEVLCIVEEPKDVLAIEKTSNYRGLYYVLMGALSPLDGITPQDLNIGRLLRRVEQGGVKEIIIATDADNDGELTAQYLVEKVSVLGVKMYRIAIGIPLGTQIEYIDPATLSKAFLDRRAVT